MTNLKKTLIKKMDVQPSKHFDSAFFEKLEREKAPPKIFAKWISWVISGAVTASVLFIAVSNNTKIPQHAFNHQEYLESVIEVQDIFIEDVSKEDTNDLTVITTDEI